MSLGTTQKTIAGTFAKMHQSCIVMQSVANRMISRIGDSNITYIDIADDMIPQFRDQMKVMMDSGLFPQAWIDGLDAYASSQQEAPSDDFQADYEAVRTACLNSIAEGINMMPLDSDGYLTIRTLDKEGYITRREPSNTAKLKSSLETLLIALG